MLKLSDRAIQIPASPIRRLAPLAVGAARAGKKIHHLNIGQPDIPTPPEMLERLRSFPDTNIAYGPSEGLPEFVEAVRRYHESIDLNVSSEQIFATTGGSEALLFVMAAIADPGDELLVFEPFYTNYSGFAAMIGVRTVPVTTRAEDGYHLPSMEEIAAAITPRTRGVLLCSPNNPTGTVYSRQELQRVADLCREHGMYLISDEVYREFTYDGLKHVSAWELDGIDRHVILTDSLSKRVSMCGARVGWVVTRNEEVMGALLRQGQARLCPPTLGQYVGAGLADVPRSYMDEVLAEYQRRRDVVYEALAAVPGVTVRRPEGAFYLCARLPVDDAEKFAQFLLSDFDIDGETTMIAPADGFYATEGAGVNEARLAYVLETERLERAMNVLVKALEAYPGAARAD